MRLIAASGLAAALAATLGAPSHRDDYPAGYRAASRAKPADSNKRSARLSAAPDASPATEHDRPAMYIGSKERAERRAVRFQRCRAPMIAKVVMRDELVAHGLSEDKAMEAVTAIVQRLALYDYQIELTPDQR